MVGSGGNDMVTIGWVDARGRLTIPASGRRKLGIVPGTELSVEVRDTELVLRIVPVTADSGAIPELGDG
jgi:AbrB family looped-hinge helix DNA binding protein